MVTSILVHGAWHSPWHWHRVLPLLRTPAVTVDLPSCGPAKRDMHADAAEIRRVLDEHDDVVLVAHSYGGIPATEAAAGHPSVRKIVYLAAYNADLGETLAGFAPADPDERNIRPDTDLEPLPDGTLAVRRDRAVDVLFHDCAESAAATEHLRSMAPDFLQQSPNSVAWHDIPSLYVVCTNDRATAVSVQRTLSERATETAEIHSSHSSFLAQPDRVAELIDNAG